MSVLELLRLGNPLLRQVSKEVSDVPDAMLSQLIEDLQDTMEAYQGAGLAAPQILIPGIPMKCRFLKRF